MSDVESGFTPKEVVSEREKNKPTKMLTLTYEHETDGHGKFTVNDSMGRELGYAIERPDTSCYTHGEDLGDDGSIVDSFGHEDSTLAEAEQRVKDFFIKCGYSFQE